MHKLTEAEQSQVRQLLADLMAIESINRDQVSANRQRAEERMAEYIRHHLEDLGMAVEARELAPGRPNLIAHWPDQGSPAAPSLMLSAHMDTVTVEGMTVDPFAAERRDGRIYGRGSCDTKGSLAAFLTALALARRAGQLPTDKLYFVATVSEETGCQGASALMESGFRTDAAIVGEPTCCRMVSAHKGPLWIEITTHGRSCHASMPEHGTNAVEIMSRVVQFVHGPWQERIKRASHPLLGESTMLVTVIEGGSKINIVPSSCRVEIDGRFIPSEPMDLLLEEFRSMLARWLGDPAAFTITRQETYPGLDCPADTSFCRRLMDLCREANGQQHPLGVNYFADTGPFDRAGIPAVLFGPGDITQAHTADEFIEEQQLYQGTEIIRELLTRHAGRSIVAQ